MKPNGHNQQVRKLKKLRRRAVRKEDQTNSESGVGKILAALNDRINDLENAVRASFHQAYGNVVSLKEGLNAAEFNLRTHQKILNAITQGQLETADGRIDWTKYHSYVETDLKELDELEKKHESENRAKQIEEIEAKRDWFKESIEVDVCSLPAEKQEAARNFLAILFTKTAEDIKNFKAGKEYETDKLDQLVQLIRSQEIKLSSKPAVVEASQEKIFGGDIDAQSQG